MRRHLLKFALIVLAVVAVTSAVAVFRMRSGARGEPAWLQASRELRSGRTGRLVFVDPEVQTWLVQQRWREECAEASFEQMGFNETVLLTCPENRFVRVYFARTCESREITLRNVLEVLFHPECTGPRRLQQVVAGNLRNPDQQEALLLLGRPVSGK